MITISDVARHCGVNESTVSRVLNNNPTISRETAQKVRRAVEELGYTPIRKHKNRQKSDEIMLAMPNTSLYTLGSTVKEMALTLNELNYDIRIVNLHQKRQIDPETARELCSKGTAGIILYGCIVPEETARVFYNRNMPVVVQQGQTKHLVSVCVNNYNGMRDAVSYVLSRGYEEVGFIAWEPSDYNVKTRFDSYRNVLEESGLNSSMNAFGQLNLDGGYQATMDLLDAHRVDAIVYATDIMAFGGIKYLNEEGIHYPRDIGLVGFDDSYMSEILGLSSMYQLLDENADLVIENLLWMITNQTVSPAKEILLTPKLAVRDSLR